jgi:N-acetylmuramic acid 6-phosphate etherase
VTQGFTIACEAGGTRTTAGLYDPQGACVATAEGGPANPVAQGMGACVRELAGLARELAAQRAEGETIAHFAASVAGAFNRKVCEQLASELAALQPAECVRIADDYHPVLVGSAAGKGAILAIAGTGSKVSALGAAGRVHHGGGRGAAFGEAGSAYHIARLALAAAADACDGTALETGLVDALPRAAGCSKLEALIPWANAASKTQLAVCACAGDGDPVAGRILDEEARRLANLCAAVQKRLGEAVPLYTHGGMFGRAPFFADAFARHAAEAGLTAPEPAPVAGHAAAYALARLENCPLWAAEAFARDHVNPLSPTERIDRSRPALDSLDAAGIVARMNAADAEAVRAVGDAAAPIARTIDLAAAALRAGGRILYAGAGTSGRLAVLDASECPPTFGVSPDRVVALIAGGDVALRHGVEGAEDDAAQGHADLKALSPGVNDIAVGVAASGTTPYVHGALRAAKEAGAHTVLLCCNPLAASAADITIALDTGPEALPGSTRLKAGTATKLALNMISTGAMAHAGYVYEGLMVGVRPVNIKLLKRAVRIVAVLTGLDEAAAATLLEAGGNEIAAAVVMHREGVPADVARQRLAHARGILRGALGA